MRQSHSTKAQSATSYCRMASPMGETDHGCAVRSLPLTGCQVTSRPRNRFSRYSKWTDTFRTTHLRGLSGHFTYILREGADKSLARPGRKQATATKLGIYSTYSPRSSIYFLARCSNFWKPLKKKKKCPSNQVSAAALASVVGRKMATFQLFFQSREQVVVRRGQIRRIGWVINIVSAGRPVSSGLQVPGEPGYCRARTRPPWWSSRGVFPSKFSSNAPAEMTNIPHW